MKAILRIASISLIPLLGFLGMATGAGVVCWYSQLSPEDRARADAIAERYASDLFHKTRSQLSTFEAAHVDGLTKRKFNNRKDW
jgi:hypothetical protein